MKETIVRMLKRIGRIFNGTAEAHAKLDAAIERSDKVRERAESFCVTEEIREKTMELGKPVGNGAH